MTSNFGTILKNAADPDNPKRTLDIMDVPDMFAERYGVHYVEPQHRHFLSTESAYFDEFRDRLKKAKSQLNQITLGALSEGSNRERFGILNISSPDPVLRLEAIDLTKRWIDHAAELGCPRVLVNEGALAPEVRKETIATLKAMVDYGKTKNVFVTMETRGDPPTPWQVLVEVLKGAGGWANPDTGNFANDEERHAGLRVMYLRLRGRTLVAGRLRRGNSQGQSRSGGGNHGALSGFRRVGPRLQSGGNRGAHPQTGPAARAVAGREPATETLEEIRHPELWRRTQCALWRSGWRRSAGHAHRAKHPT
jgi:hypothetical protein